MSRNDQHASKKWEIIESSEPRASSRASKAEEPRHFVQQPEKGTWQELEKSEISCFSLLAFA